MQNLVVYTDIYIFHVILYFKQKHLRSPTDHTIKTRKALET